MVLNWTVKNEPIKKEIFTSISIDSRIFPLPVIIINLNYIHSIIAINNESLHTATTSLGFCPRIKLSKIVFFRYIFANFQRTTKLMAIQFISDFSLIKIELLHEFHLKLTWNASKKNKNYVLSLQNSSKPFFMKTSQQIDLQLEWYFL